MDNQVLVWITRSSLDDMKPDNLVREGVVWLKKVFQPWQPGLSRRGN